MIIPTEDLTVDQVRLLLREESNRYDTYFLGFAMSKKALNSNFALSVPVGVKRISGDKDDKPRIGTTTFGNSNQPKLRFKAANNKARVLPEAKYNPTLMSEFTPGTKISRTITLSNFLKNGDLDLVSAVADRRQIVRNLYMQTFMINSFDSIDKFKRLTLQVSEGYYTPLEGETINGIRDLQTKGRAAVYKLYDKDGNIDHAKTYELAEYWAKTQLYDNIILSYDTVDPDLRYSSEIIVTMPEIPFDYKTTFSKIIGTQFNYRRALQNGFAELFV